MIISVSNKRKRDIRKSRLIKQFTEWCIHHFLSKKEYKNLVINITLSGCRRIPGTDDYASIIADDISYPKSFDICCAANLSTTRTLKFIAHELVHVKQYVKGELKDCNNPNYALWKNRRVNLSEVKYHFLPWEIEAFGLESSLVYEWAFENNLENEHWFNMKMVA